MSPEAAPVDPRFAGVKYVVRDDMKFIHMLGIGEDAYSTLKIGRTVGEVVHVSAAAGAGAAVAASGTVASTFFAGTGWLTILGLGGAAVTPIGWVVAASVATGAVYYGAMRGFGAYRDGMVTTIPHFINAPIDILGAAIVDMMGAIALRVAQADGAVCDRERKHIRDYFVKEWGIDPVYARSALKLIEKNLSKSTLEEEIGAFSTFVRTNRDCKLHTLTSRVNELLTDLVEVDDRVVTAEREAIRRVLKGLAGSGRNRRLPDLRSTWLGRVFLGVEDAQTTALTP